MALKVLVIRFSSIGDIVLTTPVVRALHEQIGAEVHFLTKPAFCDIMMANPFVRKVLTLSDDFERMILLLRGESYDHIIDLHHNLRTQRLRLSLGGHARAFKKLNFEKWLMVNFKINKLPAAHIVDRYLATCTFLNVKPDGKGLDFFIPVDQEVDLLQKFAFPEKRFAAIGIGAAHATKCMTTDQIANLCEILDMPVMLLGGKLETEKADRIIATTMNKSVQNACGRMDIFGSASVIRQAATFITHDTGLMHIAAALKKPQVVVWGNTIPQFGMYPYYGEHHVKWKSFEQFPKCRPCSKLGYAKCPKGHFKCMLDHDLHAIASAAKSLMDHF